MNRIGIDIGGTQLRVAAFGESGELLERAAVANEAELGPEGNLARLVDAIAGWGIDYAGIGIGAPGPLDIVGGRFLNPPNLPGWEGFEVARYFERACDHPVWLNNDANVAGLAEALQGAGKGAELVFFFTVSTGVGGAYVYQGEIVGGANSCAAEVFNMPVSDFVDVRPGMNVGALEDQASGTAIARLTSKALGRQTDTAEVFALYQRDSDSRDSAAARETIDRAADALAHAVCNVCCIVDPDVFVFGGSVALYNPWFLDLVHERAARLVLNPDTLRFELAQCGPDAGLIGASLLVR